MKNEIKQFLQDYFNSRSEDIEFIFLGGSGCLSYINNPHDLDIYIVYKKYDMNILRHGYRQERVDIQNILKDFDSRVVIIRQSLKTLKYWKTGILEESIEKPLSLPTYIYQTPNYEIIAGEDSIGIKDFNILEERNRFIQSLKEYMPFIQSKSQELGHIIKPLYHILTGIYILQNNSYELTQEQIDNINLVHDGNCTQELYNWVVEQVNSL